MDPTDIINWRPDNMGFSYSNKIDCGEIREVFQNESTARFEWRIADYLTLPTGIYRAPTVKYFNMFWNLEISRMYEPFEGVKLHREIATSGIRESVRFTIGYKNKNGSEEHIIRNETFPDTSKEWGRTVRTTSAQIPSSGEHTITCTVWTDKSPYTEGVPRETQTEDHLKDISILSEHFKNLLLSGTGHDILIKMKDKQFGVHKCVLQARSPVLAAMLDSKMAESADDSVTIDDCDPDVLGEFLQYVYTGKVDISSTTNAMGLYYAGDKYNISRLKELCVEFLKNSITTTTISDVISLAARHSEEELLQQAIVYLSKNLQEVMQTAEWQRFFTGNPIQANEMCLKAVQCLKTSFYKK